MEISKNTITAEEAAKILNCSRGTIDRMQILGRIKAVPTIFPRWYFNKKEILDFKKNMNSKKILK
ncbi:MULTISPECIES: helix-turn-helix domain-containing protein [Flavobacteriaceae]|uniref:DNA-binding protein n=2 Tax=Flavobacteriaceae TaxID=49546 RepID=A0A4Y8ARU0_9FLAO|nr:DNA-binding protein [Gramella jeungdoensis]GGK38602.1 hypothetical protein GCM10007963_03360 [Lutibacter litoralis]